MCLARYDVIVKDPRLDPDCKKVEFGKNSSNPFLSLLPPRSAGAHVSYKRFIQINKTIPHTVKYITEQHAGGKERQEKDYLFRAAIQTTINKGEDLARTIPYRTIPYIYI